MLRELFFAFVMVAVCVVIHTTGMVIFFDWLIRWRPIIERRSSIITYTSLLILIFAFIIILHLASTGIWAAFYFWRNLFKDYETSFYFSVGSYATIGYGDVVLPQRWRLLGGIEGLSGVLLCGLSTAFIFAIVNALFRFRMEQQSNK